MDDDIFKLKMKSFINDRMDGKELTDCLFKYFPDFYELPDTQRENIVFNDWAIANVRELCAAVMRNDDKSMPFMHMFMEA